MCACIICRQAEQEAAKKERAQRRAQRGLLSFGEDGEDEASDEDAPALPSVVRKQPAVGIRSAHDASTDAR